MWTFDTPILQTKEDVKELMDKFNDDMDAKFTSIREEI